MAHTNPGCLELVVFKVKDPSKASSARHAAQDAVKNYDGFISWTAYQGAEDTTTFADLVMWRDLSSAKSAAEMVLKDPEFASVMKAIDTVVTMSHFNEDRTVTA